jgi:type I restriction enzyme M protein
MTIPLDVLLRDSAYKLDQFKPAHINALQASITIKDAAKKPAPYVTCLVRGKPIKLTPGRGHPSALRDGIAR